jgi:pyruvate,water dikinase
MMSQTIDASSEQSLRWEAPAKGDWRGLHDHFPRALTAEYQTLLAEGMTVGEADWIERYGLPVQTIDPAFIHGRVFISAAPLIGPRSNAAPPAAAMRLAIKLIPAFRRRSRAAARAVEERPWLAEARHWFEVERAEWEARDAALAAADVASLDDAALVEHLLAVRALAGEGYRTHFRLHGCDLIPTGMLLVRAVDWGLDPVAVAGLLAGCSPTSRGDAALPDWCLVSGYDLDDRAAVELPPRPASSSPSRPTVEADEHALRDLVPPGDREEWDRLLGDARATYGVRDSNGLLTAAWPVGLLRRAMLEGGRRLVSTGHLHEAAHAIELRVDELVGALQGTRAPSPEVATARQAERRRLSQHAAPSSLGPTQDLPLGALPAAMRTIARALLGLRDLGITPEGARVPLEGVGIGEGIATGRACVAEDPAAAFARFEPGDILITAGTCPAWNTLLAVAGGVVTEEGGPLSHAAVIARELGLPALIGCAEAMAQIPDGATVELDVAAGSVRVLD